MTDDAFEKQINELEAAAKPDPRWYVDDSSLDYATMTYTYPNVLSRCHNAPSKKKWPYVDSVCTECGKECDVYRNNKP